MDIQFSVEQGTNDGPSNHKFCRGNDNKPTDNIHKGAGTELQGMWKIQKHSRHFFFQAYFCTHSVCGSMPRLHLNLRSCFRKHAAK